METGLLNSYGHHARFKRMNISTAPGYSEESEAATTSPESASRKGSSREGSVDGWRVGRWRNCGGRLDRSAATYDDKVNTKISNYEKSSQSHTDIKEDEDLEEEEEETDEEQDLERTPQSEDELVEVVEDYEEDDQCSSYDDDIIRNHINYLNSLPADSDFGECHANAENDTTHHPDSCCLPPVIHIFAVDPELDLYYTSDDSDEDEVPKQMSGVDFKINNQCKDSSSESESDDSEDISESDFEYEAEGVESQESVEVNADVPKPEESSNDSDTGIEEMCDENFDSKKKIDLTNIKNIKKEMIKADTEKSAPVAAECNDQPQLDDLKKFIFEEIASVKANDHSRSANVNRSLSLPHSPSHEMFAPLDNPEVKMSLSMEDLNFLWNFGDDQDIGKVLDDDSEIKTLTDMEVNAFLNYDSNKNDKNRMDDLTESSTLLDPSKTGDNLCEEDMEIDCPVLAHIDYVNDNSVSSIVSNTNNVSKSSTDVSVLGFCIEKPKKELLSVTIPKSLPVKMESEDFVDVETFCDNISMPVLQANNVVSLLEQFEATEKLNKYDLQSSVGSVEHIPNEELLSVSNSRNVSGKVNGLVNGIRIQEAAVQLNRNKFRHLLMTPALPTSFQPPVGCEPPPAPLDHDYCSPTKQQLPNDTTKINNQPYISKLRVRPNKQSLLKPDLLINKRSENTIKIKKKKLSEDSEQPTNTLLCNSDKEKTTILSVNTNHRKKSISSSSSLCSNPSDLDYLSSVSRNNNIQETTKVKVDQGKDMKTGCGTIKLTIKNKSKVILKIDSETSNQLSQNNVTNESVKKSCSDVEVKPSNDKNKECAKKESGEMSSGKVVKAKIHDRSLLKAIQKDDHSVNSTSTLNQTLGAVKNIIAISSKTAIKNENCIQQKPQMECKENVHTFTLALQETDKLELKKKKLNLQEYKKRREGVSVKSSNNSRTQSPNSLSGTSPTTANDNTKPGNSDDTKSYQSMVSQMLQNVLIDRNKDNKDVISSEDIKQVKKVFDPITEASKKILFKKQQKAALRKKEDEIVMSKIPKVESLELKPLLTDVEVMKYTGIIPSDLAKDIKKSPDRLKNNEYQEIVLVSIGVNTDPIVVDEIIEANENNISKHKEKLPSTDSVNNKQFINFKIKKPDSLIKNNVFKDVTKKGNSEVVKDNKDCRRSNSVNGSERKSSASNGSEKSNKRLDKDTYKNITATLKTVSDVKVSSYSLLASIQDVVMKKAPESETQAVKKDIGRRSREHSHSSKNSPVKHSSPAKVSTQQVHARVVIVNENKDGTEHGEDKVILHLRKDRIKPEVSTINIQTDANEMFGSLIWETVWDRTTGNIIEDLVDPVKEIKSTSAKRSRKRNDSDMSMSSECSDTRDIGENCDRGRQTEIEKKLDDNCTSKVASSNNVTKIFSVEPNVKEIRPKMQMLPATRSRSKPRLKRSRSRSRSRFRSRSRDRYNSRCSSNRYKNNYRPRSRSARRRNGRPHSKSPYRGRRYNHRDRRSPSYDRYRKSGDHVRSRSRHRTKSRTRSSRYQSRRSISRDLQRDVKVKRLSRSPSNKPQKVTERLTECLENGALKVTPLVVEDKKVETVELPVEATVPVVEEVVSCVVDVPQQTFTPPLRKQTTSECSNSSTSSSSSSSSNSSSSSSSSSSSFASSGSSQSSGSRSRSRSPHGTASVKDRVEGAHYKGGRPDRRSGAGYGVNSNASNNDKSSSDEGECKTPVEERRIVFVGKLDKNITKVELRRLFLRFGRIVDVTLHTKDNGARYGFVTYARAADAWTAVDSAPRSPGLARLDVGFGGRRAFCRQRYADLDGLEAEYSEGLYINQSVAPKPMLQNQDLSFDLLLQQMKVKLSQKKVVGSKKSSEKDSANSCNESV